ILRVMSVVDVLKKKFIVKGLVVMIGGAALLVLSIAVSPKSIKRLAEMTNSIERSNDVEEIVEPKIDTKGKIVKKGSTEGRIIAWNAAWAIIKEHPFGVGTGDSEAVLMKSYEEIGAIYNIEHRLNAHNQFFQSGIALGWAGLLLLCAILTMGLLVAIQKRDLLYIGFIAIVALNMMFESFLEVQSGITFVAFFYAFFVRCEFQTKSKHD
ncbi:MAG: O-antigen ligase family protein, partial [Flavobacteriales bacterium]